MDEAVEPDDPLEAVHHSDLRVRLPRRQYRPLVGILAGARAEDRRFQSRRAEVSRYCIWMFCGVVRRDLTTPRDFGIVRAHLGYHDEPSR